MFHVLSAIRPESLRQRFVSDFALSHYQLHKPFKRFVFHAIELSRAFQMVEHELFGSKRTRQEEKHQTGQDDEDPKGESDKSESTKRSPVCL